MYLRFETKFRDERSGQKVGIFTLAYRVMREAETPEYTANSIKALLSWFTENLTIPDRFSRNTNRGNRNTPGISWLKSESTTMVEKFWELKALLEAEGYDIEVIKASYPGNIIYEDNHQVVAV